MIEIQRYAAREEDKGRSIAQMSDEDLLRLLQELKAEE
jgi:hypothetical protein